MILKEDDKVDATYEGKTVRAVVTLASPNGRSLAIQWDDGLLGGHVGVMPILQTEDGEFRSVMEGKPVTLVKVEAC